MPLLRRPKTWTTGNVSATSSDYEHSDAAALRGAQQEAARQAMLYDAQVHQLQKVRSVLMHGCGGDRVAEVRAGLLQGAVFVSVWCPPCVFVSFVRPSPLTSTLTAVGVLLGFILLHPYDLPTMHAHLLLRMADTDLSALRFPEFDFDLSRVEAEWARLRASMGIHIPEVWKLNKDGREFRVGEAARGRGLRAVHPVVIVPGIISTVRPVVFFFVSLGVRACHAD